MKKLIYGILVGIGLMSLASCIKNDLPYPRIPQLILSLAAEGELQPAEIDSANYVADIYLDPAVDIRNVKFTEFTYSKDAKCDPNLLEGSYDLSSPIVVNLELYQNYQWVIRAHQDIPHIFRVLNQVGETIVDETGHRIIVKVPDSMNLKSLVLLEVQLGPEGITTMSPDLKPGPIDLSRPLHVEVTYHGRTQEWVIYAEKTEGMMITSVDAWSRVAWVYVNATSGRNITFKYRKKGSEDWTDLPAANVSESSGIYTARIDHLDSLADYEVYAVSDDLETSVVSFMTEATEILPDGDFDQWWLDGKMWCPWNQGGTRFWDTGNKGSATLGESNVQPSDDLPPGVTTGKSARLESRFVGLFGIGKFAAGSIYTGSFARVDGTNGVLDFGRPWKTRPTKLKGYYKYIPKPIDNLSKSAPQLDYMKGRPDTCHIYIALTDWTAPYQIRTNPNNQQLFNSNASYIIAYGDIQRGTATDGWQRFEVVLNYRSTSKRPTYLQITCASSKYGDYFVGGGGTLLFVDQLSLDYDY